MAVVTTSGIQLTYTGQQIDDAIRSESNSQVADTDSLAALTPTVGKVVVVENNGQWSWIDGDTTAASANSIISTVSGYGEGGANEGRWIRQFGSAGIATSTTEIKNSDPADYYYITYTDVSQGGIFAWVSGSTTTEDGVDVLESNVVGYRVGDASEGRWKRVSKGDGELYSSAFGVVYNDSSAASDNTLNMQAALDAAAVSGKKLIVDGDTYIDSGLSVKSSVEFRGRLIWSASAADSAIVIDRSDTTGESISYSSLTASDLVRGSNKIGGLEAYRGYTIVMESTEAAIVRSTGDTYYKKACFRVLDDAGSISEVFPYDISDPSTLTITAFAPESPVTISGLRAEIEHDNTTLIPRLRVHRSDVVIDAPHIYRSGTEDGQSYAVRVANSDNVVFNAPVIDGFNDSTLGYGIAINVGSNITVNDPSVRNCKHGISGRHGFSVRVSGGSFDTDIDMHWGYGLVVEGTKVRGSVRFAGGGPVIIRDSIFEETKFILSIRDDTPELRGKVVVRDCTIRNKAETGNVQVIGYGNASQDYASFGRRLVQPENVLIDNIDLIAPGSPVLYGVFANGGIDSGREYSHTMFGDISVSRLRSSSATIRAVDIFKNAGWHQLKEDSPSWVDTTDYVVNDYVINDNVTYICWTAHTASSTDEPGVGASWTDYWSRVPNPTITISDIDGWASVSQEKPNCTIKTWGDTRNDSLGFQLIIKDCKNFQPDIFEDAIQDYCRIENTHLVDDIRGWNAAAWATSTAYVVGDEVTESDLNYVCLEDHTSGTFSTDLTASKWLLLNNGADVEFINCTFEEDFLVSHKGSYRFFGGLIKGKFTSSPGINGRIKSSMGVSLASNAKAWSNAVQVARVGVNNDESIGPQVMVHVGDGDNPAWSSAEYEDQVSFLDVTEDEDVEVGYAVYSNDGTNNRRAKFFLHGTDRVFGIQHMFSSGICDFVIIERTNELMRIDSNNQRVTFPKMILSGLPTSDPTNAGELWNDSGTLKVSAG